MTMTVSPTSSWSIIFTSHWSLYSLPTRPTRNSPGSGVLVSWTKAVISVMLIISSSFMSRLRKNLTVSGDTAAAPIAKPYFWQ